MKKNFTIIISFSLLFTLLGASCTPIKQNKENTNTEIKKTTTTPKEVVQEPQNKITPTTTTTHSTTTSQQPEIEKQQSSKEITKKTKTETPNVEKNTIEDKVNNKTENTPQEEIKTEIATTTIKQTVICNSMDCLKEQAKTCTKSELIYNISSKIPVDKDSHYLKIQRTYFKMEKNTNNTCKVTAQPLSVTVTIPKESKEKALEKGFTEEDINWDLNMVNEVYNEPMQLNHITSCVGTNENMYSYFVENQEINNKNCYATNSEIICNYGGITCTLSDIR